MILRSGVILKKKKEPNQNQDIINKVQSYLLLVNNSVTVKNKCKYTIELFNYLFTKQEFVKNHNHFNIVIIKKIIELKSLPNFNLAENLSTYKGELTYFQQFSGIEISDFNKYFFKSLYFQISEYLDFNYDCIKLPFCGCYQCRNKINYSVKDYSDNMNRLSNLKEKINRNIVFKNTSLYSICFDKVLKICNKIEKIKKLEIPRHIKYDMLKCKDKTVFKKTRSGKIYYDYQLLS
mgnify:CR=1 FL=1